MLTAGTKLGPYEIRSLIGEGGMGEVYRAHDSKLGRDVALKVLPESFARDPERIARFRREARLLASLNHPNIAAIYDFAQEQGKHFLVMELVEGETLREQIVREGAASVEETVSIGKQIAEALEHAHEKNVIHRDLKPANVKLTPQGLVKVLDFGLAKAFAAEPESSNPDNSPTLSHLPAGYQQQEFSPTLPGVILGTAAYMSPEQAKGKRVDRRADIWALGCVLYELLTGQGAFHRLHPSRPQTPDRQRGVKSGGERGPLAHGRGSDAPDPDTVQEIIARVLQVDPDWSALPAATPPGIRALLRRCLTKDVNRRLRSAADLSIALEDALHSPSLQPSIPAAQRSYMRERIAWVVAAVVLLGAGLLAGRYFRGAPAEQPLTKTTILLPANVTLAPESIPIISPDGRTLAFVGRDASGKSLIWVRPLDSLEARALAGTEGAAFPFWSPDSRNLAFYAERKLKKIDVTGGAPQVLADARGGSAGTGSPGIAWNQAGTILFTPDTLSGLSSVPAGGGPVTPVTTLDRSKNESSHRWPEFLPDGRHFLYYSFGETTAIHLGSLDSKETKQLFRADSRAVYAPPGYLLFVRGDTLLAQPFDDGRFEIAGEGVALVDQVGMGGDLSGTRFFSVSETGVLAYRTGGSRTQLTWFARDGKTIGTVGETTTYRQITLSPDGRRVAAERRDPQSGTIDIWLLELSRGISSRFTHSPFADLNSIWSPDGQRIVFGSNRRGPYDLYSKSLTGTGTEELILETPETKQPQDWTRDGRSILYSTATGTDRDLWLLPLTGNRKPQPVATTPQLEDQAAISPDGRWLAYISDESGRWEVYVQPLQGAGEKLRVSSNGGGQPRWRGDGRELFYLALDGTMMAVPIQAGATLVPGSPTSLFQVGISPSPGLDQYAVTEDGQRFLVITPLAGEANSPITVIQNWPAALNRR